MFNIAEKCITTRYVTDKIIVDFSIFESMKNSDPFHVADIDVMTLF